MSTNTPPVERWFGTDGIRGIAGEGPLAPAALTRIGRALARFAGAGGPEPVRVLVAGDPRPSTPDIVARLTGAMLAEGALVTDMGMVPTPALAWGTVSGEYDLGVMISASHNPPEYNGIKPFHRSGRKLTEDEEREIERHVAVASGDAEAVMPPVDLKAPARYVEATTKWLAEAGQLDGMRVVVDCAAGASTTTGPAVLEGLGCEVTVLNPAGSRPINDGCGTQHPDGWLEAVRSGSADVGIAFDGDADRVLIAAPDGELLDGDDLLSVLAEDAHGRGGIPADAVVSTVMSNLGLEERLAEFGARLERTAVGDRNVAERMRATGSLMGGEPSGHVVLPRADLDGERPLIGDALVAAVRVLQAARHLDAGLAELRSRRPRYPQTLVGVPVEEKIPIDRWPALQAVIAEQESLMGADGRLVIRYSGTEPLLRIMAEGKDPALVDRAIAEIQAVAIEGV